MTIPCRAPPVSVQQQYQKMLEKALEGTDTSALSDEKRTDLRVFRLRNGINSSAHLAALKKIGWTIDEFEVRVLLFCAVFDTLQGTACI